MYDPVWDEIFRSRAWGRYPAEDLIRFVVRETMRSGDRSKMRALELGCGPGANLWFLANEGIAFDAIEGSATAVAQARSRLDREKPGWKGRIETGNFCRLPDDFRGYDFVLDSEAIYCNDFRESAGLIAEIYDRLVGGGAFWSRTFAPGTWGVESGKSIGRDYWIASEGPMAGKGPTRLTPRESIPELYGSAWESIQVGEITRHDGDPAQGVREWIIVARKPNQ
jgi:SAM-dependent methyltransferase